MRVQFSFHPEKCVGCGSCVIACVNENQLSPELELSYRQPGKNEYVNGNQVDITYFTYSCIHCQEGYCQKVCRQNCFLRDAETGLMELDSDGCIGCGACQKACPYKGIQIKEGRAFKCNGCKKRIEEGLIPLCVLSCPQGAITIDEKNSILLEGREQLKKELQMNGRQ